MNKKIIIGLIAIGLIGGALGYALWNKPHQNMAAAKVDLTIEAQTLLTAFENNENEANIRFLDKIIAVKGKVKEVKNENNKVCVILETESMMSGVMCNLDNLTQHTKTTFQVGEEVVFKGVCTGFLSDVVMERCVSPNDEL
jgi:hypothetical protein